MWNSKSRITSRGGSPVVVWINGGSRSVLRAGGPSEPETTSSYMKQLAVTSASAGVSDTGVY